MLQDSANAGSGGFTLMKTITSKLWRFFQNVRGSIRRNFLIRPYHLIYNEHDTPSGPPFLKEKPGKRDDDKKVKAELQYKKRELDRKFIF